MATLPQFELQSVESGDILTPSPVSSPSVVDPVSVTSLVLLLIYLARSSFPSVFQTILDGNVLGVKVPEALKSRATDEEEWWQFPVHMISLWQMRHNTEMQPCARRIVCEQVTSGSGDPFFDFAVGGLSYMMGARGSLSMVDKLQSLEQGPADCGRMVPECSSPQLRDAKGLGLTLRKVSTVLAEWLGWW